MENLTASLLRHGSIVTTEAKAKELRRFVEPLITRARGEATLHTQRILRSRLGTQKVVSQLREVAREFVGRPGGYTRITHLPSQRNDSAREVRIDIVKPPTQE